MRFNLTRFTNTFLLISFTVLTLTGVYGLFWTLTGWMFEVHRLFGWGLLAAIPWKTAIALRSLRRGLGPGLNRGVVVGISLLLATLALMVSTLGIVWLWRLGPEQLWLRQTAISWHWMLALGLLPFFLLHVWRRWQPPKRVDFTSRRGALKLLGLGAATLVTWRAAEALAGSRASQQAPRRFTGSRQHGFFTGNDFPVTHGVGEGDELVDINAWRLSIAGAVNSPLTFGYQELFAVARQEMVATLDCTLGWYTVQNWRGVRLLDLLSACGASPLASGVRLISTTGYGRALPMAEAREVLLATHVGDEVLDHVHGYPLRAVVPSRRGWFWVKWLSRVEVMDISFARGDK